MPNYDHYVSYLFVFIYSEECLTVYAAMPRTDCLYFKRNITGKTYAINKAASFFYYAASTIAHLKLIFDANIRAKFSSHQTAAFLLIRRIGPTHKVHKATTKWIRENDC